MVQCNTNIENDGGWDISMPHYCPDYRSTDIIKGNYYSNKYSWLRLAVHRCDPNDLIIENKVEKNKTCASKEEQDQYFKDTILSMTLIDK